MSVRVLFFASLKEHTGVEALNIVLEAPVPLDVFMGMLREHLTEAGLEAVTAENVRLAINQVMINEPTEISPDDEVAFLPPVTGG